jgi:Mn-dependent DtxR family transcriptional regulator
MSVHPHTVLVAVVAIADADGEPVATERLAASLGVSLAALTGALESLCDLALLEATGAGYRPTVTAQELLALELPPEAVLVVDPVDE